MVTLTEAEKQWFRDSLRAATDIGSTVSLTMTMADMMCGGITVSSNMTNEEISKILDGNYVENILPVDTTNIRLGDITAASILKLYKPDANGWILLFNDTCCSEDGRWCIFIYDKNTYGLYRKETRGVREICKVSNTCKGSVHIRHADYNTVIERDESELLCDMETDDAFIRTFGAYARLVLEVLTDVALNILHGGYKC